MITQVGIKSGKQNRYSAMRRIFMEKRDFRQGGLLAIKFFIFLNVII